MISSEFESGKQAGQRLLCCLPGFSCFCSVKTAHYILLSAFTPNLSVNFKPSTVPTENAKLLM